jgi:uroporphyrinogen-III synthase
LDEPGNDRFKSRRSGRYRDRFRNPKAFTIGTTSKRAAQQFGIHAGQKTATNLNANHFIAVHGRTDERNGALIRPVDHMNVQAHGRVVSHHADGQLNSLSACGRNFTACNLEWRTHHQGLTFVSCAIYCVCDS